MPERALFAAEFNELPIFSGEHRLTDEASCLLACRGWAACHRPAGRLCGSWRCASRLFAWPGSWSCVC